MSDAGAETSMSSSRRNDEQNDGTTTAQRDPSSTALLPLPSVSNTPGTPSEHAYLGEIQDIQHSQPSYVAPGRILTLPLVYLHDTVLFPGDELPLKMLPGHTMASIRTRISEEGGLLAVACHEQKHEFYGTTVRIERFHLDDGHYMSAVTGVAKQRFRLHRTRRADDGRADRRPQEAEPLRGDVEILPDYGPLPSPFSSSFSTRRSNKRRTISPYYWDARVYDLYDARSLVKRIQKLLLESKDWNWFRKLSTDRPVSHVALSSPHHEAASSSSSSSVVRSLLLPSDQQEPTSFSYWLAGSIPMDQHTRLKLLRINCTVQRLRLLLHMLEELVAEIYCMGCACLIAHTRDIFSMTNRGGAGTFLNPAGFVHQIMTLMDVEYDHFIDGEERSTEASWFPGYAWSILHCRHCLNHVGWRFDRVHPAMPFSHFYGLRRAALTQEVLIDYDAETEAFPANDDHDEDHEEDEDYYSEYDDDEYEEDHEMHDADASTDGTSASSSQRPQAHQPHPSDARLYADYGILNALWASEPPIGPPETR